MLLTLPDEILLNILKHLDLLSKFNVSKTCVRLSNLLHDKRIVGSCIVPANNSSAILKSDFLSKYGSKVEELVLSEVSHLPKSVLLSNFKKLKQLKRLDVSTTKISIPDFVQIADQLVSLEHLSIDYKWDRGKFPRHVKLKPDKFFQYCEAFKNLTSIHLSCSLLSVFCMYSPFWVLKHAVNLKEIKLSVGRGIDNLHLQPHESLDEDFSHDSVKKFSMVTNVRGSCFRGHVLSFWFINTRNNQEWEYLFVKDHANREIVLSKRLYDVFIKDECSSFYKVFLFKNSLQYNGNFALTMWHKDFIDENPGMAESIVKGIKQMLPIGVFGATCDNYSEDSQLSRVGDTDLCFISTCAFGSNRPAINQDGEPPLKKKRISKVTNTFLNLDSLINAKSNLKYVRLQKMCRCPNDNPMGPLLFGRSMATLKHLTHFSLNDITSVDPKFFETLFKACHCLETFCYECTICVTCPLGIINNVHRTKTLKNVCIAMNSKSGTNFDLLFTELSRCPNLENILILDKNGAQMSQPTAQSVQKLVGNCKRLYAVTIHIDACKVNKINQANLFQKSKKKYHRPDLIAKWDDFSEYFSITPAIRMYFPIYDLFLSKIHKI